MGDIIWVKCIDPSRCPLTHDKVYEVDNTKEFRSPRFYYLKDDQGGLAAYYKERFIVCEPSRTE